MFFCCIVRVLVTLLSLQIICYCFLYFVVHLLLSISSTGNSLRYDAPLYYIIIFFNISVFTFFLRAPKLLRGKYRFSPSFGSELFFIHLERKLNDISHVISTVQLSKSYFTYQQFNTQNHISRMNSSTLIKVNIRKGTESSLLLFILIPQRKEAGTKIGSNPQGRRQV